jgi:hypothetical protein
MQSDLYAVTEKERGDYLQYSTQVIKQIFRPLPPTLWYYTSGSTFAHILKTNSVWSTQISCLNDHTEFRYAVRLLREEFKTLAHDADENVRWLAAYLYDTMAHDGADISQFFVFCMSLMKDDLSQWRAYGGGEGGVCIGFDPMRMMTTPDILKQGYLVPVLYLPNDHKVLVTSIAGATMRFFKEGLEQRLGGDRTQWAESFLEAWREQVIYFAPVLKDSAFVQEREWRLIYSLPHEKVEQIEIKQRSTLISRHLPLSFGDKLPIREVIVGPCRHPSVSLISVGTYLRAKGYQVNEVGENNPNKVTVSSSTIPFQTM